ncbi:hypothetical protein DTO96_101376 [Ephemeroptericola cinctiostellae]|uniref:Molybdopterin synthase sulfur carrier subunit n=1 Tax=Ephemeroptericola cinctiostellae TaxID=2268024 RepID=A0A345DBA7_9BURK|nr:MoaD/ThiS family protein [Ephemeroptericola cinctiostellae]AXF85645.1 hypothetical protein DTO96_101376 [Ephemeroptericola cinctiostellae]
MIHIQYFGALHDQLGCASEQLAWTGGTSQQLLTALRERGEPWFSALQTDRIFKIAVNRVLKHEVVDIHDGDDVGILPPVTGG